jgi:hypothetical protein
MKAEDKGHYEWITLRMDNDGGVMEERILKRGSESCIG